MELFKAFEVLQVTSSSSTQHSKADALNIIATEMTGPNYKNNDDYPKYVQASIASCLRVIGSSDDVQLRMTADEKLTVLVDALIVQYPERVLAELLKGMRFREAPRAQKVAVTYFGKFCHRMVFRVHVAPASSSSSSSSGSRQQFVTLCLAAVLDCGASKDDQVQNALAGAMDNILKHVAWLWTDNELNTLLTHFFSNLETSSDVTIRSAADIIASIVANLLRPPVALIVFTLLQRSGYGVLSALARVISALHPKRHRDVLSVRLEKLTSKVYTSVASDEDCLGPGLNVLLALLRLQSPIDRLDVIKFLDPYVSEKTQVRVLCTVIKCVGELDYENTGDGDDKACAQGMAIAERVLDIAVKHMDPVIRADACPILAKLKRIDHLASIFLDDESAQTRVAAGKALVTLRDSAVHREALQNAVHKRIATLGGNAYPLECLSVLDLAAGDDACIDYVFDVRRHADKRVRTRAAKVLTEFASQSAKNMARVVPRLLKPELDLFVLTNFVDIPYEQLYYATVRSDPVSPNPLAGYASEILPGVIDRLCTTRSFACDLSKHTQCLRLIARVAYRNVRSACPSYFPRALCHVVRVLTILQHVQQGKRLSSLPASTTHDDKQSVSASAADGTGLGDNIHLPQLQTHFNLQTLGEYAHEPMYRELFTVCRQRPPGLSAFTNAALEALLHVVGIVGPSIESHCREILPILTTLIDQDPQFVVLSAQELFCCVFGEPLVVRKPPGILTSASIPLKRISKLTEQKHRDLIALFEPIVVGSMKHYVSSSNVNLHQTVLFMLTRLASVGVDYSRLDKDQQFIHYVLSQSVTVTPLQCREPGKLLPYVYDFLTCLVRLSCYPKLLSYQQMLHWASNALLSPSCTPEMVLDSLPPLVLRVFHKSTPASIQDELFALLVSHMNFPSAVHLLYLGLLQCRRHASLWERYSSRLFDKLLPLLTCREWWSMHGSDYYQSWSSLDQLLAQIFPKSCKTHRVVATLKKDGYPGDLGILLVARLVLYAPSVSSAPTVAEVLTPHLTNPEVVSSPLLGPILNSFAELLGAGLAPGIPTSASNTSLSAVSEDTDNGEDGEGKGAPGQAKRAAASAEFAATAAPILVEKMFPVYIKLGKTAHLTPLIEALPPEFEPPKEWCELALSDDDVFHAYCRVSRHFEPDNKMLSDTAFVKRVLEHLPLPVLETRYYQSEELTAALYKALLEHHTVRSLLLLLPHVPCTREMCSALLSKVLPTTANLQVEGAIETYLLRATDADEETLKEYRELTSQLAVRPSSIPHFREFLGMPLKTEHVQQRAVPSFDLFTYRDLLRRRSTLYAQRPLLSPPLGSLSLTAHLTAEMVQEIVNESDFNVALLADRGTPPTAFVKPFLVERMSKCGELDLDQALALMSAATHNDVAENGDALFCHVFDLLEPNLIKSSITPTLIDFGRQYAMHDNVLDRVKLLHRRLLATSMPEKDIEDLLAFVLDKVQDSYLRRQPATASWFPPSSLSGAGNLLVQAMKRFLLSHASLRLLELVSPLLIPLMPQDGDDNDGRDLNASTASLPSVPPADQPWPLYPLGTARASSMALLDDTDEGLAAFLEIVSEVGWHSREQFQVLWDFFSSQLSVPDLEQLYDESVVRDADDVPISIPHRLLAITGLSQMLLTVHARMRASRTNGTSGASSAPSTPKKSSIGSGGASYISSPAIAARGGLDSSTGGELQPRRRAMSHIAEAVRYASVHNVGDTTWQGLDISCLVSSFMNFLGQMVTSSNLTLRTKAIKSILVLSKLFDRGQYEWMLAIYHAVYARDQTHDMMLRPFLALGVCKAVAVLCETTPSTVDGQGYSLSKDMNSDLQRLLTECLQSPHLSLRLAAIRGYSYLIEAQCGIPAIPNLLPTVLQSPLMVLSPTTPYRVVEYVLPTTFHLLEKYPQQCQEQHDFTKRALQGIAALIQSTSLPSLLDFALNGIGELLRSFTLGQKQCEQYLRPVILNAKSKLSSLEFLLIALRCDSLHFFLEAPDPPQALDEYMTLLLDEFVKSGGRSAVRLAYLVRDVFDHLQSQKSDPFILLKWMVTFLERFLIDIHDRDHRFWCMTILFLCVSHNRLLQSLFDQVAARVETADYDIFFYSALDFYYASNRDSKIDEAWRFKFISIFEKLQGEDPVCDVVLAYCRKGESQKMDAKLDVARDEDPFDI